MIKTVFIKVMYIESIKKLIFITAFSINTVGAKKYTHNT